MIEFAPSDFVPLADFPLAVRWTRPAYSVLPHAAVAELRPLGVAAARQVASEARARCAPRRVADLELSISADADAAEAVHERLFALPISPASEVIVSWDQNTALVTRWRVFVDHWPDFCYPSSDDVTVWEPGRAWALCYRHFQVFEFASNAAAS